MKTRIIPVITMRWLALAMVLALLLLGHSFGDVKWLNVSWQPAQMWSKVDYDPKLSDPFFDADEWFCKHGSIESAKCRNGKRVKILKKPCKSSREEPCFELDEWTCPDGCKECAICSDGMPVVKSTAKCVSSQNNYQYRVSFCEAKLSWAPDIDLLIHTVGGGSGDGLQIQFIDGYFRCQYWTVSMVGKDNPDPCLIWTTKHQKLTLDREVYRPGDEIKGRIEFECLEEPTHPKYLNLPPKTIKLSGVFKTIVQ